jgi:glycosyltransferase involved in cell wall biosynthesis
MDDNISFQNHQEDMGEIYRKADILLNFSENESFSMVCLEALAYGKPLIATNSGGPAEIIDNGIDGLLIPNKDIDKMKDAILELSSDQFLREKFALNGPLKVRKRFNFEEQANKLGAIYQKGI